MLKTALKGLLTDEEIKHLSSSFDVIGDIAIIKIPSELSEKESLIGEELLRQMKNVTTVLKQNSDIQGEYRTRDVSVIAGLEKYETIYKESGISLMVDVRTVYFSPRLSTERLRIRSLVKNDEKIFNMFAGIGTFSFVLAKTVNCRIYSVDKNPEAIRLATESLNLNKRLKGIVVPILSDATEFASLHPNEFDRVLMPLPERSRDFLHPALNSAKASGAIVHYYVHVPESEFEDKLWIRHHLDEIGISRKYEVLLWKKVREVGPRYIQAVADIQLK
jgi:tRNA (guanine37-N1)-methyltransferase